MRLKKRKGTVRERRAGKCVGVCAYRATAYLWCLVEFDASKIVPKISEVTEKEQNHVAHIDEEGVEEGEMNGTSVRHNKRHSVIQTPKASNPKMRTQGSYKITTRRAGPRGDECRQRDGTHREL